MGNTPEWIISLLIPNNREEVLEEKTVEVNLNTENNEVVFSNYTASDLESDFDDYFNLTPINDYNNFLLEIKEGGLIMVLHYCKII